MLIITKRETQKSVSARRIFPFEIRLFREYKRERRDWIQHSRLQQREKNAMDGR